MVWEILIQIKCTFYFSWVGKLYGCSLCQEKDACECAHLHILEYQRIFVSYRIDIMAVRKCTYNVPSETLIRVSSVMLFVLDYERFLLVYPFNFFIASLCILIENLNYFLSNITKSDIWFRKHMVYPLFNPCHFGFAWYFIKKLTFARF